MRMLVANQNHRRETVVPVMLTDVRVTKSFRETFFDAALQAGMTPTEFAVQAAAEKLASSGKTFSGLFHPGDIEDGRLTELA